MRRGLGSDNSRPQVMPTRGLGDVDLEALLQKSIPSPNTSTLVIVISSPTSTKLQNYQGIRWLFGSWELKPNRNAETDAQRSGPLESQVPETSDFMAMEEGDFVLMASVARPV